VTERLRQILADGLEAKVRRQYERIVEAMLRDLAYLAHTADPVFLRARDRGWTAERVQVVLAINAFHRTIMGPLEAAFGVELKVGLGRSLPIVYGRTLQIDTKRGAPTRKALAAYHRLLDELGFSAAWLSMTRVSDVLFSMGHDEEPQVE
jgi:hypothetical protein